MITQSQYFAIEEYLQNECRVIEPELLEELIDHFMNGSETVKLSEEDFIVAFEVVKADFGGEYGLKKIQRDWQVNSVRVYVKSFLRELISYFQKPYWWRTTLFCLSVTSYMFYYSFRFPGWERPYMWIGGLSGCFLGVMFLIFSFLAKNKSDYGFYGLQARNWYSILIGSCLSIYILVFGLTTYLVQTPFFVIPFTAISVIVFTLAFVANFRFSNRELYPEHT